MDFNENLIFQYLKSYPNQFVSRKEICRRAGGKSRFRENENWAGPILQRMLEINLVETNSTGHFRLAEPDPHKKKKKSKQWISPAIKAVLKQSGREFAVFDLDQELDAADLMAKPEPASGSLLDIPTKPRPPAR